MKSFGVWFLVLLALSGCGSEAPRETPPAAPPDPSTTPPEEPASGDRFRIDPSSSRLTAHVGVSGLLAGLGHEHTVAIRRFEGDVVLTPGTVAPASLRMTAQAASVAEVGPGFNDADRRKIEEDIRGQALEVSRFDRITFRSTSVSATPAGENSFELTLTGLLDLHGVERPLTFPARLTLDGDSLTAHGEFRIRHGDYNIERLSAGLGTIKAAEEITISFDVRARRPD